MLHIRHETLRKFVCDILRRDTDLVFEVHETLRHSLLRGDYRGDLEIYFPGRGRRPVLMDVTVVDPAVPRDALQRWRRAVVAAAAEQKVAENREPNEAPASAPHEADVSGVGAEAQP